MLFFFFSSRRRHTRCGRDWSSDVCSSDLARRAACARAGHGHTRAARLHAARNRPCPRGVTARGRHGAETLLLRAAPVADYERALCAGGRDRDLDRHRIALDDAVGARDEGDTLWASVGGAGEEGDAEADREGEGEKALCGGGGSHVLGRRAAAPLPTSLSAGGGSTPRMGDLRGAAWLGRRDVRTFRA